MAVAPEDGMLANLRRGTIEYCVLAALRGQPRYAPELVAVLSASELVTSEGTIYPLLSRLRREGLLETSWAESPSGPPRRYYVTTAAGRRALSAFRGQWAAFRDAVDQLVGEGE
jgi:PadR family transcriptional regulator PadR